MVKRVCVAAAPPIRIVPVTGVPLSPFFNAAAPPDLNAATSDSASRSDILRSIVIVTGALADPPPAPFTAAVAVNTSGAAFPGAAAGVCPRKDAGIISKATDSTVALIVFCLTVIAHLFAYAVAGLEPVATHIPRQPTSYGR